MPPATVTTHEFSVPDWLSVVEYPDSDRRWPGATPPRLHQATAEANTRGHMLTAWVTRDGREYPYGFGSVAGSQYVYPAGYDPAVKLGAYGTPERKFFLYDGEPPADLASEYDPPEGHTTPAHVYQLENGITMLAFLSGGVMNLTTIGAPGDTIQSLCIRLAVAVNIIEGSRLGRANRLLPYAKDTHQLSITRLLHAEHWQFEKSRTRSLFA